jgi:hypothetical protein
MEVASSIDFSAFCHCDVNAYAARSFLSIFNRSLQSAVSEPQPAKMPLESGSPSSREQHLMVAKPTVFKATATPEQRKAPALWLFVLDQEPKATMRV